MMSRIFKENLADIATIIATDAAGLPAENVQDTQLSKIARITGTTMEFDFGAEKDLQAIILANHNLTAQVNVAVASAGDYSAWTTVSTMSPDGPVLYAQCNPVKAKKVRLTFNEPGPVDIGRVYLGGYRLMRRGLAPEGYGFEVIDESAKQTSVGGQEYTSIQPQRRSYTLSWAALTESELVEFKSLYASHGTHTPFFFWMKELMAQPEYVKLDGSFAPELIAGVLPRRWNLEVTLKQQL